MVHCGEDSEGSYLSGGKNLTIDYSLIRLHLAKLKNKTWKDQAVCNLTASQNKLKNVHKNIKTSRPQ